VIESFPFLGSVSPQSRERLFALAVPKRLENRQALAQAGGECAYLPLVLQGTLRVYKTSEAGKELTLYRIERGESCVLTATCILNGGSFPAVAEAERATDLLLVPARLFARFVEEDKQWRRFVFALYSRRLEMVLTLVEEVAFHHVDARLASYLFARSAETGGVVNRTHAQIAAELGTSREVVTRILRDFEVEGLLETRRGRIQVLRSAELQEKG